MTISYLIENEIVYRIVKDDEISLLIKEQLGTVNKIETIRIDDNTVADVSYTFDLVLGDYIEQSRVTRNEPLPPVPETDAQKISRLEAKNIQLDQQLAQQNADFTAFQDFYFSQFPSQA